MVGVFGFEALRFGPDDGFQVVAAGLECLAPLPDVGVVLAHPGPVGRLVYGDLESRVEDDLARAAGVLRNDLGGDVAPPDDREHGGHVRRLLLRRAGWTWRDRRNRSRGARTRAPGGPRRPRPASGDPGRPTGRGRRA